MEQQRIGTSSQPLEGAGFDPAFIPGLTSPAAGEPEDATEETPEASGAGSEETGDVAASEGEPAEAEPDDEAEDEAVVDGPVFEAADFRARIVADRRGVRLSLDEERCEFRWDEIGAVETETARFGKRYTVTVHTHERRWYPIEILARSRSQHKEWDERLDEVLDAYFEEGAEDRDGDAAKDRESDD
ncbi:hypothetical protein [Streptomyces sp. NPDC006610]|uniref:hypothetical protein n=1 Tax=Streptomyces sp. NPDC006610 TaxID=3154584 RepID=UPI0033A9D6FC